MTVRKTNISSLELQIALDNRAFEIQLFWQRSNYFMVLMTALGVGVFTIKEDKYAIFVSLFAMVTSWFWYRTNLGSKFWQESWEVEVVNLAKEQKIRSFERPTDEIIDQVRQALADASAMLARSRFQMWIDRQILKKPSVSHYMIKLSLFSTVLWAVVSFSLICDYWHKPKSTDVDTKTPISTSTATPSGVPAPVPAGTTSMAPSAPATSPSPLETSTSS